MSNRSFEMPIYNSAKANTSREIANQSHKLAITERETANSTDGIAVARRFSNDGTSEALNRIPSVQECDATMFNSSTQLRT